VLDMPTTTWLDHLPLWGLLLATVLVVLASIEGGYRLAMSRSREAGKADAPISSVVGGMLGLLAFLLAFTFALTASRFDTRKELLLDEVNAIDTCYQRAAMTSDPQRSEIRERLREYVTIRAELVDHPEAMGPTIARSEVLLGELWAQAIIVGAKDSEMNALFVESLNVVMELHRKRVVVSQYRIPGAIWIALLVLSTLAMVGVGYQFGLANARERAIRLALALAFSIVVWLIASLERNYEGALTISQQPMIDLDRKLSAPQ
jgi:hypothetical protein